MAIFYTRQEGGTYLGLEDDILITLRPLAGDRYACEISLGEEVPAYQGEAAELDEAKARVQAWLCEALAEGEC